MTSSRLVQLRIPLCFCVFVIISLVGIPPLTYHVRNSSFILNRTSVNPGHTKDGCQQLDRYQLGAQREDFKIAVDKVLSACFQPEKDSPQLAQKLNFMWREKWAPIYRRGCWAPVFSRINKINHTLIIDCPPSMQPKYGFKTRLNVDHLYTAPVSLNGYEWIYAKCTLPFYSTPTVHLHLHAQPLPSPSIEARQRPNVVFLQFDALGRQAMYRRMPQSYNLLKSFSENQNLSFHAIEFRHLNVNGRNSEPNMRQLYCGSGDCQRTSFLRLYKQMGYSTSLLESYSYHLSNFLPTNAIDRFLGNNYFAEFGGDTVELYYKKSGCVMNSTWIVDEMLDYLQDRFKAMHDGGWFSINNIVDPHSEDELSNYAVMDGRLYEFLQELEASKVLNNTILILLADHGLHGHDWQDLWRAYDHRNPFLQILIGKDVDGCEEMVKNLKLNSNKLITHADLYMTFAKFSKASLPLSLTKAVNLFQEQIPVTRTCRSANLPDEWCNCWVPKRCT